MKVPFSIAGVLVLVIAASWPLGFDSSHYGFLAGLMPIETTTAENIRAKYNERRLKILLVPGHDNIDSGTEFNGVREADLTRKVARHLYEFLAGDGHFQVSSTRDFVTGEYESAFASYFKAQENEILSFRIQLQELIIKAIREGLFQTYAGVGHNRVSSRIAQKLYGINKWANENGVDIVLHTHFNDHAGRRRTRAGNYFGFTVYVPEKQFSSAKSSVAVAESVFSQLKEHLAVSSLPGENQGITEDQDLIALGANGSLDAAVLLIEYGYIYEPQFTSSRLREDMMRELGYQTYLGLKKYFEPDVSLPGTTLLPFLWEYPLQRGVSGNRDVLSLQLALRGEGLYPPPGKTLAECALTGSFGECTMASVALFQEKYSDEILEPFGLSRGTGKAGTATLKKLQTLYPVEL